MSTMAGMEVAGLVFKVIKLAETTIRGCQRIIKAIRDAPKELRVLVLTISSFKDLLQHVESFMGTSTVARDKDHLKHQVQHAQEIIKDLDVLVVESGGLVSSGEIAMARFRGA
ncbi:hypothetical protein DL546_005826 [Coniochaeta pulveracea]|uniref:Fungal N-terminal domain-containing protein n=1 Tax=Coniochaeta pulveracea TaxID=177199 RepID=A0A420Y397_9PEZI|nr:hypothetical protein DL546_005826 [Coniochaeta pulveracea]